MRRSAMWLVLLTVGVLPPAVFAAADFDSANAAASTYSGRSLKWQQAIGGAANRVLVVGVTTVDNQPLSPEPAVTFNGTPLQPVPGGVATTSDDKNVLRTQLFYLLDAALPAPGTYEVAVTLAHTVSEIGGGSIALYGLAQAPPEAVAANTSPRSAGGIATPLATLTRRAWIVDIAGVENDSPLTTAGSDQILRLSATGRRVAIAGSAARAIAAGPHNLSWTTPGRFRIAEVAAAFAPLQFSVTVQSGAHGSVTPGSGVYSDGDAATFTADPDRGYALSSWSGDASGSQNPTTILVDGPKRITAAFDLALPDFEKVVGWATQNGGVTGGQGGGEVVVDTVAKLKQYASSADPYVIKISGTIYGNDLVRVQSNKTILGIGNDARLLGVGLQIGATSASPRVQNVIVRNVSFQKDFAPLDGITIQAAKNVWVDHCDFSSDREHGIDFYDGLLDINSASDFITVSWCRFHDHFKTSLIGHSDDNGAADTGHLTVTFHHNSFINSGGRNPSVRFGLVHIFNNFFQDLDDYAIASRENAQVVIENNVFDNVKRPIRADTSLSPIAGQVRGTETNTFINSTPISITTPSSVWLPPYEYSVDPNEIVQEQTSRWAGVGVVTYPGVPPIPSAPVITVQPKSQTVDAGTDVSFNVLADGTYPFAYQWFKNGAAIAGETSNVLSLKTVALGDSGNFAAQITNAAGTATSDPAVLTVKFVPPPATTSFLLDDKFTDGSRTNQALPDSAAWFTSSGSNNLTVTGGQLVQLASSSRTLLAYFTNDQAQPVTLNVNESLRLSFTFRIAAFDPATDNFRIGLLRSVANPAATTGAGFVATPAPNTNARLSGDFGSSNPTSNVFSLYSGYATFTVVGAGTTVPVRFLVRNNSNAALIGSSTSGYTNLTPGSPTPSTAMSTNTPYRGVFTVTKTTTGATLSYIVTDAATAAQIMANSTTSNASIASFDTVAFFLARSSTVNPDLTLSEVSIEKVVP